MLWWGVWVVVCVGPRALLSVRCGYLPNGKGLVVAFLISDIRSECSTWGRRVEVEEIVMSVLAARAREIEEQYAEERAGLERLLVGADGREAVELEERIAGLAAGFMWLYGLCWDDCDVVVDRLMRSRADVLRKLPVGREDFVRVFREGWCVVLGGEHFSFSDDVLYEEFGEELRLLVRDRYVAGEFDWVEARMLLNIAVFIRGVDGRGLLGTSG